MDKIKFSDFTNGSSVAFSSLVLALYISAAVKHSSPVIPYKGLMVSLVFLLSGITFFIIGIKNLKAKKFIEDIPTSKIRSIAMGLVELIGKTAEICRIISPISKTACVYYSYTVEKKVSTQDGYRWKETARVKSDVPFYLEDETARVLIDPRDVFFDYESRFTDYSNDGNLRYREWNILNHEEIFLIGTAEKSRDFLQQSKDDLIMAIRKLKWNQQELMKFDSNKDGKIDLHEWDSAVNNVTIEQEQEKIRILCSDPLADIVVKKGSLNSTFIISEKSQKDLINKYFYRGLSLTALGVFVSLLSVVIVSAFSFLS